MIADYKVTSDPHKLGKIFKHPTKITVNGIVGKNKKIFVIDNVGNGNIEDLLEKTSPIDYNAAKSYVSQQIGDNKPMTAFEFMRRAIKNNPNSLDIFKDLILHIIK